MYKSECFYNISIHALREEGDFCLPWCRCSAADFYPRPPRGGRRFIMVWRFQTSNFYPRPPRGGRQYTNLGLSKGGEFLSTPSARRATIADTIIDTAPGISIHALREEGDNRRAGSVRGMAVFLSTPSARRATSSREPPQQVTGDFYPRPPRGGRRRVTDMIGGGWLFLSTPSARRATHLLSRTGLRSPISIHALREEGDRF